MQKGMMRALLFAGVLALGACSGDDGSTGATGPVGPVGPAGQDGNDGAPGANGQDLVATAKAESCATCHPDVGTEHQAVYKKIWDTPILAATVGTVSYDAAAQQVTVNFSLTKNAAPYTADITKFAQKTVYVAKYDRATRKFGSYKSLSVLAPGATAGTYTAKNDIVGKPAATPPVAPTLIDYDPTTADAFVYVYFAENPTVIPFDPAGHYRLYDDVASAAKQFNATAEAWSYVTAAKSTNCEKCHPAPYMKHGYRAGAVAGVEDMVACKACHGDARGGTHPDWQVIVTDPLRYTQLATTPLTDAEKTKYAYVASVMNDTHMSHAMEFAYPQSMANCVTCHEGRLDQILTDEFFTLATCKSCHPLTTTAQDAKRAPALQPLMTAGALGTVHTMAADLYAYTGECNTCHKTVAGFARPFAKIHTGYNKVIYSDTAGTKFSSNIKANLGAVTFDSATNKLTIPFTVTGASATAIIKPTVVISLYGYDTKDFIVGGHASQPAPDGKRNLEWTEGASGNSPRLTVVPGTAAASWTATADLSLWANLIANGTVKRAEIGILPALGVDQTKAPNNSATTTTGGVTSANPNYNPYLAVAGVAKTFDLVGNAIVADATAYGRDIVSPAKCDKCHEALGTTFHSPAYGSAGVVGCRLCHVVGSGGSHLEMQSRSIDSYIHAIHSMQPFDIGDIDFADPVEAMHYGHHVESTYPNFTTLNCESCHNAGKYNVPDQSKSLPGIISAADKLTGADRAIGAVPSYVTGPASRACGGCHRAQMLNEDDAGGLASFNAHTAAFGTHLENKSGVFDTTVEKVMSLFK
jgi:hypothetical protein